MYFLFLKRRYYNREKKFLLSLVVMIKINRISPENVNQNRGQSQSGNIQIQNMYENSAMEINRIQLGQNNQKNKKNQIKQSPVQPTTLYTCRICLQQGPALHANNEDQLKNLLQKLEQESKLHQPKYLITTCKCQGTSGYLHQRCIIQWIDAQYKRSKQKQMKCEICLTEILYERKTIPYIEFALKNLQNVSPCNYVCFVSIFLMLIGFVGIEVKSQALSLNDLTILTIFALIGILTIAFGLSAFMVAKEAFYRKKKQTSKVYTNDQVDICGILKDNLTYYDRKSSTHRTQVNGRSVRTIRSTRSIRDLERQNRILPHQRQQRVQSSHRQRSQRTNGQVSDQQRKAPPRSQRSLRGIRHPRSARTVQIRSRQQIENSSNY